MQRSHPLGATTGFTLVEMLVVIAVIGVLVALLLPAVQMAREAGRRANCSSNLRQIGLAVESYSTAHNSYPPGAIQPGTNVQPSFGTWTISILPHLERKDLYDEYDHRLSNEENATLPGKDPRDLDERGRPRPMCQKFVSIYSCPSDINRKSLESPATGPGSELRYMPGSYRGVGGRGDPVADRWWDHSANGGLPPKKWRGVFHMVNDQLRPEKSSAVKDGTSNTLMVGEYCTTFSKFPSEDPLGLRRRTFWAYSNASYNRSDVLNREGDPDNRTLLADLDRCTAIGSERRRPGDFRPCMRAWGSFHSGVVNFLMCDGSTPSIAQNVDMNVLAAAATIDGYTQGSAAADNVYETKSLSQ